MTRGTIRTMLRRQIQDVPGVQWSSAELNEQIDATYSLVQKEIFKSFPEAHLFWDTMDVTAGTSWYPLPATFGIASIGLKSVSTATYFTPLKRKRYADILTVASVEQFYSRRGQWIGIFPVPAASVTNGLEIVHTPIMSMSEDTDVPRIKTPLHPAIALWAKLLLLGELDSQPDETANRLREMLSDIPNWYESHTDESDKLIVER